MENWKCEIDSSYKCRGRDCHEIKELRRFCYEEADKTIQSRIEEMVMNQDGPSVVNQDMSEIQELQNKVNSLTDARDFHDPEGRIQQLWIIPRFPPDPSLFRVAANSQAANLQCRMIHGALMGTSGNVC